MAPSSLKKMRGSKARKEGNHASSSDLRVGRSAKNDLGLTLLPGSQIQLEDEHRPPLASASKSYLTRSQAKSQNLKIGHGDRQNHVKAASVWDINKSDTPSARSHETPKLLSKSDSYRTLTADPLPGLGVTGTCPLTGAAASIELSNTVKASLNKASGCEKAIEKDGEAEDVKDVESAEGKEQHNHRADSASEARLVPPFREQTLSGYLSTNDAGVQSETRSLSDLTECPDLTKNEGGLLSNDGDRDTKQEKARDPNTPLRKSARVSPVSCGSELEGKEHQPESSYPATPRVTPYRLHSKDVSLQSLGKSIGSFARDQSHTDYQSAKRSADWSSSWTSHFPKKQCLESRSHHRILPAAQRSTQSSGLQHNLSKDTRHFQPTCCKLRARSALPPDLPQNLALCSSRSSSLEIRKQQIGKDHPRLKRSLSLPDLGQTRGEANVGMMSMDELTAHHYLGVSLLKEEHELSPLKRPSCYCGTFEYRTGDEVIINRNKFLHIPDEWLIPSYKTNTSGSSRQRDFLTIFSTSDEINGASGPATGPVDYQTLSRENKAMRNQLSELSSKYKTQKVSNDRVLLDYGKREALYQKTHSYAQRLEEEVIALRKDLSASEILVVELRNANSVLQNRLKKYAVLPRPTKEIARDILRSKLPSAGSSADHVIHNDINPQVSIENSLVSLPSVPCLPGHQRRNLSNAVGSSSVDNINPNDYFNQPYSMVCQHPVGTNATDHIPLSGAGIGTHQQLLHDVATEHQQTSGVLPSSQYRNIPNTTQSFQRSIVGPFSEAGVHVNNTLSASETVDLTNDDLPAFQPLNTCASPPSILQEHGNQTGIDFNLGAKELAWLDGGHPSKGQAHNAQRKRKQAVAKQNSLPSPDPNSVAPSSQRAVAKKSRKAQQKDNDQLPSRVSAQQKPRQNAEDAHQASNRRTQTRHANGASIRQAKQGHEIDVRDHDNTNSEGRRVGGRPQRDTEHVQAGKDHFNGPSASIDEIIDDVLNSNNPEGSDSIDAALISYAATENHISNKSGSPATYLCSVFDDKISPGRSNTTVASGTVQTQPFGYPCQDNPMVDDDMDSLFDGPMDADIDADEVDVATDRGEQWDGAQEMNDIDDDLIMEMHNRLVASHEEVTQVDDVGGQNEESEESEE